MTKVLTWAYVVVLLAGLIAIMIVVSQWSDLP